MKKLLLFFLSSNLLLSCANEIVLKPKYDKNEISTSSHSPKEELSKKNLTYFLPKTVLAIDVDIIREVKEPGYFQEYARNLMGMVQVIDKFDIDYYLSNVEVTEQTKVDHSRYYSISSNSDSITCPISLTKEQLLCGINTSVDFENIPLKAISKNKEIDYKVTYGKIPPFKEMMKIKSKRDKAIYIANVIYKIRNRKFEFLNREGEELPKDGESYKQIISELNQIENSYKLLFSGATTKDTLHYRFFFDPSTKKLVDDICYINNNEGIVTENSGRHTKSLNIEVSTPKISTETEQQESIKNGIIYKQAFGSKVKIKLNNKIIKELDVIFPQLNDTKNIFIKNDTKKVIWFNPHKGSLKSVR